MNHLQPKSQAVVHLDETTRIGFVRQGCLLDYPQAGSAIGRIIYIIEQPDSHRMVGGLLHGPSNNGKTTILQYIVRKYRPVQDAETGECRQPVVYVNAPLNCDERLFFLLILQAVGCPPGYKDRNQLFLQVIQILKHLEVKLLIVDEFQQLLDGTPRQQRTMLTTLKLLSDMVRVPIVGAGLDSANHAVRHDAQLFNRLRPIALPLWTTSREGLEDYRSLLKALEGWLPLRQPSNLGELSMAQKISGLTKGLLGEIVELLKITTIYAIQSGAGRITATLLDEVVTNRKLYVSPQDLLAIGHG